MHDFFMAHDYLKWSKCFICSLLFTIFGSCIIKSHTVFALMPDYIQQLIIVQLNVAVLYFLQLKFT